MVTRNQVEECSILPSSTCRGLTPNTTNGGELCLTAANTGRSAASRRLGHGEPSNKLERACIEFFNRWCRNAYSTMQRPALTSVDRKGVRDAFGEPGVNVSVAALMIGLW
jgi:hypothetical protein